MAKPISTSYTDEEKAEIIAHVLVNVASGRPVDRIFREDESTDVGIELCDQRTFWKWLFADEKDELGQKLARAREFGIEALLDKAISVAETPMMGESHVIERIKPADMDVDDIIDDVQQDLVKTTRGDMTAHRKLYIETMFKAAQMLKLDLTSKGERISVADELEAAMRREARRLREEQDRDGSE
jgi:hypothetical protein